MKECEFRKIYIDGDKVGILCGVVDSRRLRITCELVCKECGSNAETIRDVCDVMASATYQG